MSSESVSPLKEDIDYIKARNGKNTDSRNRKAVLTGSKNLANSSKKVKLVNLRPDLEESKFPGLFSTENVPMVNGMKSEAHGVRLNMEDISESEDSIIQLDDEKSEYQRSQTFRQNKDLGHPPIEYKQKIQELKKIAKMFDENLEPKENAYTQLPSVGDNCYGYNVQRMRLKINFGVLLDSIILWIVGYLLSYLVGTLLAGLLSFALYLLVDLEFFADGISIIDTTQPVTVFKAVEKIPASANIIYEDILEGFNINKYNIMMKHIPLVYHENPIEHTKVEKLVFTLPETMAYKSMCADRICYVRTYHGVDDDGTCYIISKKLDSTPEWYSTEVHMAEYEECLIIEPISGAESKVIFLSKFDYGGKIPGLIKHKIASERLKHLKCLKSYFYDCNQVRIYESFRKAAEIVNDIRRASMRDIELSKNRMEYMMDKEEVKLEERDSDIGYEFIPKEDSADADEDIDEASEIQSLNESYMDLTSTFMKSNPFIEEKLKRNTINAHPSHAGKLLSDKDRDFPVIKKRSSSRKKKEPEVEVIYEEIEDDVI